MKSGIVSLVCAHVALSSAVTQGSQRPVLQHVITPSMTTQISTTEARSRLLPGEARSPLLPYATERALAQADNCPVQLPFIVSGDEGGDSSRRAAHDWFIPEIPGKALENLMESIRQEMTATPSSLQGMHISVALITTGMNLTERGDHNSTADHTPNASSIVSSNAEVEDGTRVARARVAASMPPRKRLPTVQVSTHKNAAAASLSSTAEQSTVASAQPQLAAAARATRGSRGRLQTLALQQVLASIEKLADGVQKQQLLKRAQDCADADSVVRCYYARDQPVASARPQSDAKASATRGSRGRLQTLALQQVLASIEKLADGEEKQQLLRRAQGCADADSVVRCYYGRN